MAQLPHVRRSLQAAADEDIRHRALEEALVESEYDKGVLRQASDTRTHPSIRTISLTRSAMQGLGGDLERQTGGGARAYRGGPALGTYACNARAEWSALRSRCDAHAC